MLLVLIVTQYTIYQFQMLCHKINQNQLVIQTKSLVAFYHFNLQLNTVMQLFQPIVHLNIIMHIGHAFKTINMLKKSQVVLNVIVKKYNYMISYQEVVQLQNHNLN